MCFAQAVKDETVYLKVVHVSRRRHFFLFSSAMKTKQEIKANKVTVEVKTQYHFVSSNQEHRHQEQCVTMALKYLINFAVQLQPLQPDASD